MTYLPVLERCSAATFNSALTLFSEVGLYSGELIFGRNLVLVIWRAYILGAYIRDFLVYLVASVIKIVQHP